MTEETMYKWKVWEIVRDEDSSAIIDEAGNKHDKNFLHNYKRIRLLGETQSFPNSKLIDKNIELERYEIARKRFPGENLSDKIEFDLVIVEQ